MEPSSKPSTREIVFVSLNDDLIIQILKFLKEDLKALRCLGLTNRKFARLVFEDFRTDFLFGKHYRQYWKNLYNLHQLMTKYRNAPLEEHASYNANSKRLNRLGILTPEEEKSAIPFDHPHRFPADYSQCSGYFGFLEFPTEVAVWGDYSGVSFLPNMAAFLHPKPKQSNGTLFGESFQVMAVCVHQNFLFLGFASGEIHCISMIATSNNSHNHCGSESNTIIEYPYLSGSQHHAHEITSLSVLGDRNLVSASMTSRDQVIIHWGALEDGNLANTYNFHIDTESILSMASTTIFDWTLLHFGCKDQLVATTAWNQGGQPQILGQESCNQVGTREGHVLFLKYLGNDLSRQDLLVGLSSGEVLIFEHEEPGRKGVVELMDLGHPKSEMPSFFTRGYLEAAELVGDILVLAGGPPLGEIHFYDMNKHICFATRTVHPGVPYRGQGRLYSSVIALHFSHQLASLICLCRDGHVHQMSLSEELKREEDNEKRRSEKKRAISQQDQSTRPMPPRRARLQLFRKEYFVYD